MRALILFAWLTVAVPAAFAADYGKTSCNDAYDSCISSCCLECGGFSHYDNNYNRVCDDGNGMTSPECSSACSGCMPDYLQCTGSTTTGGTGSAYPDGEYSSSFSCCSGFIVLSLLGAAFAFKKSP